MYTNWTVLFNVNAYLKLTVSNDQKINHNMDIMHKDCQIQLCKSVLEIILHFWKIFVTTLCQWDPLTQYLYIWKCIIPLHLKVCIYLDTLLEKDMASYSSTLAWKIPWTEEPVGLPSMRSHRVRRDWSDFTFTFHFHALEKEMATH